MVLHHTCVMNIDPKIPASEMNYACMMIEIILCHIIHVSIYIIIPKCACVCVSVSVCVCGRFI